MADTAKRVRVFVASPGDVQLEREQLAKVVSEINLTINAIAPEKGIVLELVRWETHVHPGIGRDPQDVVNRQIGEYDIFIGIMWKRFGTPTAVAGSGTEEEFRRAHGSWRERPTLQLLFYFCQAPLPPPATREEAEQLVKVVSFREELSATMLVSEYPDPKTFGDVVRPHLILVLSQMLSDASSPADAARQSRRNATASDIAATREQVAVLAREYEQLRESLPSGNERTRLMEVVESRMRSLALQCYPIVGELARSPSAGERLAAVATLKEIPDPQYLTWLADRVGVEKPFLAYHATVALLQAAHKLAEGDLGRIRDAIQTAQRTIQALKQKDLNQVRVLEQALGVVEQRMGVAPAK